MAGTSAEVDGQGAVAGPGTVVDGHQVAGPSGIVPHGPGVGAGLRRPLQGILLLLIKIDIYYF